MTTPTIVSTPTKPAIFSLESSDFVPGSRIPDELSCSGSDLSPTLTWKNAPDSVKSFAVFMDDPDAPSGSFTHWLIANIPATTTSLPKGVSSSAMLTDGSIQGKNSFGSTGYKGPCPPPGTVHNYVIHLYALDNTLPLSTAFTKADFESALVGHILSEAKLTGSFGR